ncbi:Kelch repeat-containing protein [Flammeovirga kamogawensis]|uniref:Galactose oxidase n=1 Tax=Flammeovirga kamogawensis TaxID=373891 RepID=A0ABX8H4Q8_9BACT|nr:kelch repeat-containing protein [Flammeovirga kamogawensis]MBB6461980.1 N-acetylneuraminic acid mutarotase [Flammeovirga kamogawensis]QWG10416.1 hypothetical protein KM029_25915 [Flammeovirga kamogawensis]TRX63926.1 hypothetical protein EO216_26290 [Flammeovirga kamogawensis]
MKTILLLLLTLVLSSSTLPVSDTLLKFDIHKKALMPSGAYDFGAEIYKGKIYTFLESTRNLKTSRNTNYRNGVVCVYDISTNKWEAINEIPKRQKGASSTIINNKIYLVGGYDSDLIQVYNIDTNEWEEDFKLPFKFHFTTVESYNNKLFIIGGYANGRDVGQSSGVQILDDVHIYNTSTKEWKKGMPYHRKASGLNSLKYKNEFYVWSKNEMFKYNPRKDTWTIFKPLMNKMQYSQEGTVLNNKFYFTNGINSGSELAKSTKKLYSYDIKSGRFDASIDDLIYGRKKNYKVFGYNNSVYILGGKNDEYEGNIAIDDLIELQIKN